MSPEFSKLCRRLAVAIAVAVLTPLATAAVLGSTQAAADSASVGTFPSEDARATPAPQARASLSALGRADAVAWMSTGHVSAP